MKTTIKTCAVLFYLVGFLVLSICIIDLTKTSFLFSNYKFLILVIIIYSILILIGNWLLITTETNRNNKERISKISIFCIFIIYIVVLCGSLFKSGTGVNYESVVDYYIQNSTVIPFKTISFYLSSYMNNSMNKTIIVENLLGNLLLFIPMGVFSLIFIPRLTKLKYLIFAVMIVLVEIIQLLTRTGFFDIDDIILNLIGFLIGVSIMKLKLVNKVINDLFIIRTKKVEEYETNNKFF